MIPCMVSSVAGQHPCPYGPGNQNSAVRPLSHPFVERLIGTIRWEHLDQTLFWTGPDLEEKLRAFQDYFNKHRVHSGLKGQLPDPESTGAPLRFASYRWQKHCGGLYQTPIAA